MIKCCEEREGSSIGRRVSGLENIWRKVNTREQGKEEYLPANMEDTFETSHLLMSLLNL